MHYLNLSQRNTDPLQRRGKWLPLRQPVSTTLIWTPNFNGSMVFFNSLAVSNKLFTALFWQIIKICLTKCDNCLEVKWTIAYLLKHKIDSPCVKVQQRCLCQTGLLFRGNVSHPTFRIFFFFFGLFTMLSTFHIKTKSFQMTQGAIKL